MKILFGNCQKHKIMGYYCFLAMLKVLKWIPFPINELVHHIHVYINTPNLSRLLQKLHILVLIVNIFWVVASGIPLLFDNSMIHLNKFYSTYLFMQGPSFLLQSYLQGKATWLSYIWHMHSYGVLAIFGLQKHRTSNNIIQKKYI